MIGHIGNITFLMIFAVFDRRLVNVLTSNSAFFIFAVLIV